MLRFSDRRTAEETTAGSQTGENDPFESFNSATGSGQIRDPYPTFASLREQSPVYEGRLDRAFGLEGMSAAGFGTGPHFVALGYDAVSQVLLDGQTFSSKGYADTMGVVMGHSILEMDEPEHRTYRGLIQQAFTLKSMKKYTQ